MQVRAYRWGDRENGEKQTLQANKKKKPDAEVVARLSTSVYFETLRKSFHFPNNSLSHTHTHTHTRTHSRISRTQIHAEHERQHAGAVDARAEVRGGHQVRQQPRPHAR